MAYGTVMERPAQGLGGECAARVSSKTEVMCNRLSENNQRLRIIIESLVRTKTRAFGSFPEKAQGETPRPEPNGVLGSLERQVDDQAILLGYVESLAADFASL